MISLKNISKSYGENCLFSDVTFTLGRGEKAGLTGRNGHGKSTLMKIIAGIESSDEGDISIPKGYRIGFMNQVLDFTSETVIGETSKNLPEEDTDSHIWKAEKALAGLGFETRDLQRKPSEFSGGYQMRIELAKLLAGEPDLLLLDEPNNFLDIESIIWLEKFLADWKGEMILISHNRTFMDSATDTVMGIHRKRFRRINGSSEDYYKQIEMEEDIHEKSRVKQEAKQKHMRQFINKFRAKARQGGLVQSRIKTLEKMETFKKLSDPEEFSFSFSEAPFNAKHILQANGLSFSYSGKPPFLFENLDFTVKAGERIAIIGKNGKGKSTLLKILCGMLDPVEGGVEFHKSVKESYYSQDFRKTLRPDNTVLDEISLSVSGTGRSTARSICGAMMFPGNDALKNINVLSGGEKCRVLLGKAAAAPSNLLLLDEPTQHLDMPSVNSLIDAVNSFSGTVIIVTHDERILRNSARRLIIFRNGGCYYFKSGYDDYISEYPWEGDDSIGKNKKESSLSKHKTPVLNKKEKRKKKSMFVQERSRLLGPLKKKIGMLESEINLFEEKQETANEKLVELSYEGAGDEINRHSKNLAKNNDHIENLYRKLEKYYQEHERIEKELAKYNNF